MAASLMRDSQRESQVKTKILDQSITYTGEQLQPLWNYLEHGLLGDSLVAWVGPCQVTPDHMLDGEDLRQQARIAGDQMVHLICELFDFDLAGMVGVQRLTAALLLETLEQLRPDSPWTTALRQGDDLYLDGRKFNISIATCSARSSLMHFAFNVSNQGTPVPTSSLQDWNLSVDEVLEPLLERVQGEVESLRAATWKVRLL